MKNHNNLAEMVSYQTGEFTNEINQALGKSTSIKLEFEETGLVYARVNTTDPLNYTQLERIVTMKHTWNFKDVAITRSGANLKIAFNPDYKSK